MQITFKLYATLTEYLPADTKGHAVAQEITITTSVQEMIERFQIPDEMAFLVMLNGIYIQPEERASTCLKDNDTLAIWPKVAGG